jgi:enamine deaminase RidA (YjgF/YER057c/UK114 family)
MAKEFFSPATLPPPVGYSHIAKVNKGTLIYLAGQVSSDASGALVGEGNFEAQAERVFANVKIAVEAAGATMADIVKLNTYIVAEVDPAEIPKMRGDPRPLCQRPEAAGEHAGGRQPPGAARLADRGRGGGGDRRVKRKRRPRGAPLCRCGSLTPPWS